MNLHPADVDPENEKTWARHEGVRGDRFHIYDETDSARCASLCGQFLDPEWLRRSPSKDARPSARACPLCVSRLKAVQP